MVDHETWTERQDRTAVTVDGHDLEVAYYESGPEDGASRGDGAGDEPPVVFLHGIPTWSFLWRDVAPAVAEDRRVIAPDLVGFGNSAMHDGFDRSIRAQEAMLEDLVDQLVDGPVALVAHDIGGGVALRYAAHNPDGVDQLVVSNAVCYDSWPVEFINDLGLPSTIEEIGAEGVEAKLDYAFGEGLYGDDPNPEFVEGMKAPWDSEKGRISLSRNAAGTNTSHTKEIDYEAITAETLLLWGDDDVLQPVSYAERLAGDLQDARLSRLSEAFHWVVEDRTETYRDRLRSFLAEGEP